MARYLLKGAVKFSPTLAPAFGGGMVARDETHLRRAQAAVVDADFVKFFWN